MKYEYEPIKDLEKEIEYVRYSLEKISHTHQKAVVESKLEKLEERLHKFKQANKADELQTINGILLGEIDTLKINLNYYKKQAAKADEYEAKAKAFDLIDGYLTEAYNNYHDVEDENLRGRLISGFISSKVTLLFQEMIEKHGDKEGDRGNA